MKQRLFLMLVTLLPLAGFAQEKDPFIGRDKREIIKEYGTPSAVQKVTDGEILIYNRDYQAFRPSAPDGDIAPSSVTTGGGALGSSAPHQHTSLRERGQGMIGVHTHTFMLNKNGKVRGWKIS